MDMQELAKTLGKKSKHRAEIEMLAAALKDNEQKCPAEALAVPTGRPLSIFDPVSFPAACIELLFGDCHPCFKRVAPVTAQQVFDALPRREELECPLAGDEETYGERYQASDRSRWDTPEFCSVLACFFRSLKLLQCVDASFDRFRTGFQTNCNRGDR